MLDFFASNLGYAIWGLIILLSFCGWGKFILSFDDGSDSKGWGFEAGIGMSAVVAIGGLLLLLRGFGIFSIVLVLSLGVVFFIYCSYKATIANRNTKSAPTFYTHQGFAVVLVLWFEVGLLALRYLSTINNYTVNAADDLPAYLTFSKMMLDTGTFIDPYSLRRLSAYGGQWLLQSFLNVVSPGKLPILFENGVCPIIVYGILRGMLPKHESWVPILRILFLGIVSFKILPAINLAANWSGVVAFLTVFRGFQISESRPHLKPLSYVSMISLPLALAVTLRANFIAPVAVFIAAVMFVLWKSKLANFPKLVTYIMGSFTALLVPWMAVQYLSSSTILYPVFRGNHRYKIDIYNSSGGWFTAEFGNKFSNVLVDCQIPLVVCICMVAIVSGSQFRKHFIVVGIVLLTGVLSTLVAFPDADRGSFTRYTSSFVFAGIVFMMANLTHQVERSSSALSQKFTLLREHRLTLSLIIGLMMVLLFDATADLKIKIKFMTVQTNRWGQSLLSVDRSLFTDAKEYGMAQAALGPKNGALLMVDRPYHFDFSLNRMANLDWIGLTYPKGCEYHLNTIREFADAAKKCGYSHLIMQDPKRSLNMFNEYIWKYKTLFVERMSRQIDDGLVAKTLPATARPLTANDKMFGRFGERFSSFFELLTHVPSHAIIFKGQSLIVVDLEKI
ncbi:MAG: hypothetical protein NT027_13870 [Proteobacteria bacterium]|nr:hypothetical protein [Pseudomonadota bacterium]